VRGGGLARLVASNQAMRCGETGGDASRLRRDDVAAGSAQDGGVLVQGWLRRSLVASRGGGPTARDGGGRGEALVALSEQKKGGAREKQAATRVAPF
jgi:hypothetical protein